MRTTEFPFSFVLLSHDLSGNKNPIIPNTLSQEPDSIIIWALSIWFILPPLTNISTAIRIHNLAGPFPRVLTPFPLVDIPIQVEHFTRPAFKPLLNLPLIPLPIRIQINPLLMIKPIFPFPHIHRTIRRNQHTNPIPHTILTTYPLKIDPSSSLMVSVGLYDRIAKLMQVVTFELFYM